MPGVPALLLAAATASVAAATSVTGTLPATSAASAVSAVSVATAVTAVPGAPPRVATPTAPPGPDRPAGSAGSAPSAAPGGGWRWPVPVPVRVLRPFSPPASPWGPGHRGVDLAVRPGVPVMAAGAGRIAFAGRVAGIGVVVISHGRLRTTYLPVAPSVRTGRPVAAGERIGTAEGPPGHCGMTSCLHWGLRDGPVYRDPRALPGLWHPVRLLPIWPVRPGLLVGR